MPATSAASPSSGVPWTAWSMSPTRASLTMVEAERQTACHHSVISEILDMDAGRGPQERARVSRREDAPEVEEGLDPRRLGARVRTCALELGRRQQRLDDTGKEAGRPGVFPPCRSTPRSRSAVRHARAGYRARCGSLR